MPDQFRAARASNRFDQLVVDLPELYERHPLDAPHGPARPLPLAVERLYRSRALPFSARLFLWRLLHRLRLDQGWFDEFVVYWMGVLKGRPLLSPEDFHFLRGVYRLRHQDNQVPSTDDDAVHLAAWQQPELLSLLFHQVFIESLSPKIRVINPLRYVSRGRCLDFGCGVGSLTATDCTFFPGRRTWVLTDLPTLTLHYAAWRFARQGSIKVQALSLDDGFAVPTGPFDAICCITVFEHLPRPLSTARQLAHALAPGGYLFFDYVISEGTGLDTISGLDQRPAAIAFLCDHFDLVSGTFSETSSMDLTILRRRWDQ